MILQLYGYEDHDINKKVQTIPVKNINLLYWLADRNLLEYLMCIGRDRDDKNNRVWFFEQNAYVLDEIYAFYNRKFDIYNRD